MCLPNAFTKSYYCCRVYDVTYAERDKKSGAPRRIFIKPED